MCSLAKGRARGRQGPRSWCPLGGSQNLTLSLSSWGSRPWAEEKPRVQAWSRLFLGSRPGRWATPQV